MKHKSTIQGLAWGIPLLSLLTHAGLAQTRLTPNPATLDFTFTYSSSFLGGTTSYSPTSDHKSFSVTGASTTYRASVQTQSGKNYTGWVSVTPSGSTDQAIVVTVTPKNLPEGKFLAMVTVTFSSGYTSLNLPVTVSVVSTGRAACGFACANLTAGGFGFTSQQSFDLTQPQMPPNCEIGSTVAACIAGIDDLQGTSNYVLSAVTVDGGNWLQLSNTAAGCTNNQCAGTTPDSALFTIDPTQLPVGQGATAGYVVVDGGQRGMDYLIVQIPALPAGTPAPGRIGALTAVVPPRNMGISYIDAGNGSQVSIRLVNIGSLQSSYQLKFWGTTSGGTVVPLAVPMADGSLLNVVSGSIPAGGMTVINTSATAQPEAFGWAELVTSGNIQGYAVLTQSGPNQVPYTASSVEAGIPFNLSNRRFTLPWDNTNGSLTEVFLSNPGATSTSITMNLFDSNGKPLSGTQQTFQLGAGNQTWFVVSDAFPQTTGAVGVMTLSAGSAIAATAMRFDVGGPISYSPTFSIPPTGYDAVLPVFPYGGGWTTTFSGINPFGSSNSTVWSFYQPASTDAAPGYTLDAGVVGRSGTSTVTQNTAGGGSVSLMTSNPSDTKVGWVDATQNGSPLTNAYGLFDITGQASIISTYMPLSQPFQDRGFFPFDNTGGFISLLFVINEDPLGTAQFTLQVRDEAGNANGSALQLADANNNPLSLPYTFNLAAHTRMAFQLEGGARGTIQVTGVGHLMYGLLFRLVPGSMFTSIPGFQGYTGQ